MDDWDTVTKIGSKTRGGGAARETTVRGKSALNAAQRSGAIVATEKKFATGNAATKGGVDGQRAAKVDRSNDIIAPKKVGDVVGKAILKRCQEFEPTLTQAALGKQINLSANEVARWQSGEATPDEKTFANLEKILGIKLRGNGIGEPTKLRMVQEERKKKEEASKKK